MNPIAVASKSASPRLHRIQKISRTLKAAVLLYFVVPLAMIAFNLGFNIRGVHLMSGMVSIFNHPYASVADIPAVMHVLYTVGIAIYLLGLVAFYRLLGWYEKGVIFSPANIAEMRKIGMYLVSYGLLAGVADVVYVGGLTPNTPLLAASPWMVAGGAIQLIAWIMDEGRKIQEEQELTV